MINFDDIDSLLINGSNLVWGKENTRLSNHGLDRWLPKDFKHSIIGSIFPVVMVREPVRCSKLTMLQYFVVSWPEIPDILRPHNFSGFLASEIDITFRLV